MDSRREGIRRMTWSNWEACREEREVKTLYDGMRPANFLWTKFSRHVTGLFEMETIQISSPAAGSHDSTGSHNGNKWNPTRSGCVRSSAGVEDAEYRHPTVGLSWLCQLVLGVWKWMFRKKLSNASTLLKQFCGLNKDQNYLKLRTPVCPGKIGFPC